MSARAERPQAAAFVAALAATLCVVAWPAQARAEAGGETACASPPGVVDRPGDAPADWRSGDLSAAFSELRCVDGTWEARALYLVVDDTVWSAERATLADGWRLAPPVTWRANGRVETFDEAVFIDAASGQATTASGTRLGASPSTAGVTGAALGYRAVGGPEARTGVLLPLGRSHAGEVAAHGGPQSAGGTVALHDASGAAARLDIGWLDGAAGGFALADEERRMLGGHALWSLDANYGFGDGRAAYALAPRWTAAAHDRLNAGVSVGAEPVHLALRYRRRRSVFVVPGTVAALDAIDGDAHVSESVGPVRTHAHLAASRVWYDEGDTMGAAARLRASAPLSVQRLYVEPGVQATTSSLTVRTGGDTDAIQEARFSGSADVSAAFTLVRARRGSASALAYSAVGGEAGEAPEFDIARRSLWNSTVPMWRTVGGLRLQAGRTARQRVHWTTLVGAEEGEAARWSTRLLLPAPRGAFEVEGRGRSLADGLTFARATAELRAADDRMTFRQGFVWSDGAPGRPLRPAPEALRASHSAAHPGTALRQGIRWDAARVLAEAEIVWARGSESTSMGAWGTAAWRRADSGLSIGATGGWSLDAERPSAFAFIRAGAHPGGRPFSGLGPL